MGQFRDQFDDYRRTVIGQLEDRQRELERKIAEAEADKAQIKQQLARAQAPAPPSDLCPACFVNHGRTSPLTPADGGGHGFDNFRCSACGYETQISA